MFNPITHIDKLFQLTKSYHTVQPYIVHGLLLTAKYLSPIDVPLQINSIDSNDTIRRNVNNIDLQQGL